MANIHAPERQQGESQQDYRNRRAYSSRVAQSVLRGTRKIDPRELGKPLSSTDRERARVKAERPTPPQPKFTKGRTHKPHHHPLRDAHGAYTLVGRSEVAAGDGIAETRRMWLAGISAQRGF